MTAITAFQRAIRLQAQLDKANAALRQAQDEVARLREALEIFADDENWRYGRRLDPANGSRFDGTEIAAAALKPDTGEKP